MQPLPKSLPTMPNPCAGVPVNPWCPGRPISADAARRARMRVITWFVATGVSSGFMPRVLDERRDRLGEVGADGWADLLGCGSGRLQAVDDPYALAVETVNSVGRPYHRATELGLIDEQLPFDGLADPQLDGLLPLSASSRSCCRSRTGH